MRVVNSLCTHAAYQLRFRDETICDPAGADDPDSLDPFILGAQHGTGNILCPFQIYNFAVVRQIVELPGPVGTNRENIYFVLLDVAEFLAGRLFNDNLIGKSGFFNIVDPCHQGINDI